MFLTGSLFLSIAIAGGIVFADVFENNTDDKYCNPELCPDEGPHIGCKINATLNSYCGETQVVDMNPILITLILDLHNVARNRTASGNLKGYQPAIAMPVLKWDDELQYLAGLNVRTCQFKHDACRNTERFPYSGQNLGLVQQSGPILIHSVWHKIKSLVNSWFNEFHDANQDFIDFFTSHPEGKQIGHFTQMVSDRAQRVGCAALINTQITSSPPSYDLLFACNYDFSNINSYVYKAGDQPATDCSEGQSKQYLGLCDWGL